MDDAFYNWLAECKHKGDLTDDEIEDCLHDSRKAYELFSDFLSSDWGATAEMVQEEIKDFKRVQAIKWNAPKKN